MNLIESLNMFIRIVERKGLAAAGRELGLSPSMVTERLFELEAYYGARLLNRTTRSISLTEEGRLLVDSAYQLVNDANDIQARIKLGVEQLSGLVRLSAPIDLGQNMISKVVDTFIENHPNVSVELYLSDEYVDIAGEGIDLAVRMGDLKDSSLVTVRLASNRRIVCATPRYLQQHGTPQIPSDLMQHNCLLMRFGMSIDREWIFAENGKRTTVHVSGNRIANDGYLVRQWCLKDYGIALKSYWDLKDDLEQGRLIELLSEYANSDSSVQAVYYGRKKMPRRVRKLIEALAIAFSS